MEKRSFFSQLWLRFKAETPSFFRKIIVFGMSVSTLGTTLSIIPNIPEAISTIAAKFIWVGLSISAVAKAVVKNGEPIVYKDETASEEEIIQKANEPAQL